MRTTAHYRFALELQDHPRPDDAEQTLRAVIGWGWYAELFGYDDATRTLEVLVEQIA